MEMTSGYISDRTAMNSYSKGWELFTSNVGLFLGVVVVQILISLPAQLGNANAENPNFGLIAFANAWSFFVVTPIGFSTAWVFLRAARGDSPAFTDMFAVFQRNYVQTLIAGILMGLIIFAGLLLLIIPGIYFALRLSFVSYLVIDSQMNAVEAIKTSWEMTKGHAGTLFFMGFIGFFVIVLGILALGVGVIVSTAVLASTFAVFYHSVAIVGKQKAKNDDFDF
ncbi:MAG: hypothetical protein AAF846_26440 [Chloroflexota bacterium]